MYARKVPADITAGTILFYEHPPFGPGAFAVGNRKRRERSIRKTKGKFISCVPFSCPYHIFRLRKEFNGKRNNLGINREYSVSADQPCPSMARRQLAAGKSF